MAIIAESQSALKRAARPRQPPSREGRRWGVVEPTASSTEPTGATSSTEPTATTASTEPSDAAPTAKSSSPSPNATAESTGQPGVDREDRYGLEPVTDHDVAESDRRVPGGMIIAGEFWRIDAG